MSALSYGLSAFLRKRRAYNDIIFRLLHLRFTSLKVTIIQSRRNNKYNNSQKPTCFGEFGNRTEFEYISLNSRMLKLNSQDIDFRELSSCIRSCIWAYPLAAHALFEDFRQWWAIMNSNISGRFYSALSFFSKGDSGQIALISFTLLMR